jgi:hypothetical protein
MAALGQNSRASLLELVIMKLRSWLTQSYESVRAELDEIVGRYRARLGDTRDTLTREEAVRRIRVLGFTEGDALRWLGSGPGGRAFQAYRR